MTGVARSCDSATPNPFSVDLSALMLFLLGSLMGAFPRVSVLYF